MSEPVAVIGAGRMGGAMAARLAGAGFAVTVWNRTPQRGGALADEIGAAAAATAREAVGARPYGRGVAGRRRRRAGPSTTDRTGSRPGCARAR